MKKGGKTNNFHHYKSFFTSRMQHVRAFQRHVKDRQLDEHMHVHAQKTKQTPSYTHPSATKYTIFAILQQILIINHK